MAKKTKSKRTRKAKRFNGRGVIVTIVMMLTASAVFRIGAGSGQAIAQAVAADPKQDEMAAIPDEGGTPAPMDRTEINGLLFALREREERVRAQEMQIEVRSKALQVANAEIDKRLATLEETEANLRRTLALADGAAEDDLARLTTVYENMKPKEAAALFEAMEPDFAAGFLGRMRPDAAASIMAGLTPEIAYSISVILAGRNANAPKS